jgi:hypothetical protein
MSLAKGEPTVNELPSDAANGEPTPPEADAQIPADSTPADAVPGTDDGTRSEQKGAAQRVEQLKPFAVAAEDAAYQVVKASQKGLNWLAGYLGERHDRRATAEGATAAAPPATGESTAPEDPGTTA